jgi:hypothetical protein
MKRGKPQKQAVAIALSVAKKAKKAAKTKPKMPSMNPKIK